MRNFALLTLLVILVPGVGYAQTPEELLPSGTQLYVRWDGVDAHRDAYNKTALGKMMQGDTGRFVEHIFARVREGIGALLTVEQLLGGAPPDKLEQMSNDANEAAKLLPLIGKHGFVFAVHVGSLQPPQGQITLIVPHVGDKAKPILSALRLAATLNKVDVKKQMIAGREVYQIPTPFVNIAWWVEGKHAILNVGTQPPETIIANFKQADKRLPNNPLYQRITKFDKFPTAARAYLDVSSFVALANTQGPPAQKLIQQLGVDGLKNIVLYSGFDGEEERGLVEVTMPGPRKGLLTLFDGKPFRWEDLPALPPDVTTWNVSNFDARKAYDVLYETLEQILPLVDPDSLEEFHEGTRQLNLLLGIDLKKDLLDVLGTRLAYYTCPSEGPINLGGAFLLQVKDADKVKMALEQVIKALAKQSETDVRLKKRTYRGVEVREVHVKEQGFFFVPTYAIHNDWLVISYFPQAVHGYLLRATGEIPAWKPDARVQAMFEKLPKEMTSVNYSDPVPTLKTLLGLAPTIAGLVNSFNPEGFIDIGTLPNGQEATRHLFPNVSVTSDDGKVLRIESRASLSLPFDLTGVDTYFLSFAFFGVRVAN